MNKVEWNYYCKITRYELFLQGNILPVGWSYRIHQLLLCRGVRTCHLQVSWIYIKHSNGEFWGMPSTPSLPSLPGQLWPWIVAPDRVWSIGLIELNSTLMLNWIVWNRTVFWHWTCLLLSISIYDIFNYIKPFRWTLFSQNYPHYPVGET